MVKNTIGISKKKSFYVAFLTMGLALLTSCNIQQLKNSDSANNSGLDSLRNSFLNPPPAARPGVYWFWMGGQLSQEGITKDLEAMAEQGIGKVLIMQMPDQAPYPRQWSYQDYPDKVKVLSDAWFDLVNFAVGECDRLGVEMAMFTCPGWGHVGGPWVPADKGTKQMAMTSVSVSGPTLLDMKLPKPAPAKVGGGGNIIPEWNHAHKLMHKPRENFFRDEAVLALPQPGKNGVIALNKVINVTDYLAADGKLTWQVPEGNWTIMRVCLVSENGINHPAPPESFGLEVDRMDPDAVRIVFDNMIGRILREAQAKGYQSFKAFETDSYELGWQDFGLDFRKEFMERRGYDCTPWLPAWNFQHAGIVKLEPDQNNIVSMESSPVVIESKELTARFHTDMLRTITELWAERFQGTLRKLADEHGITWMTEPYFRVTLDWTTIGGTSTMPGSEFWVTRTDEHSKLGNAPEIAALYNRKVVWAEAFTAEAHHSAWRNDPWMLKRWGDAAFARGINQFYMHGFAHNPFPDQYQPGFTMGNWGTQFCRHLTWWKYSSSWHQYLARCQYMLQQGKPVYHVLRYPGVFERYPIHNRKELYRSAQLTDELLLEKLSVRDNKLVLPHGAEFSALHLTGSALRTEALMKIKSLVKAGATLIADRPPSKSASLENYPACDEQLASLISEIWGKQTQSKTPAVRELGKGRVISGMSLEEGMQEIGKNPDFTYDTVSGQPHPELLSYQRITDGETYWFVSNQGNDKANVNASFEISGLQPEWWDAVDGSVRDLPDFYFKEGRTILPLTLEPFQSGFVMFRKRAIKQEQNGKTNFAELKLLMEVSGSWEVSFDKRWGGPEKPVNFPQLTDWSKNKNRGIKYYSGTAVYRKVLDVPSALKSGSRTVYLELGTVNDLAQVKLNGEDLGIVWCAPWRVKVPDGLLKKTGNQLEITVVNNWPNRMIGDEQEQDDFETEPGNQSGRWLGSYDINKTSRGLKELPDWLINNTPRPSSGRYTFTSWFYYDKDAPLQKAGLLGPVKLYIDEN